MITEHFNRHPILKFVIQNDTLAGLDLSRYQYNKEWEDFYTFKNLVIQNLVFSIVEINVLPSGIFITLFSDESIFYDDPLTFFGTEGIAVQIPPELNKQNLLPSYRRKLGNFEMLGKTARISVTMIEGRGSKIKIALLK